MKKKKKIFCCLLFLIYMLLGSGAFFGIKGYEMYREAITDEPIDQRIEKIRSQENYVDYDSLPKFYVKATISIEDRRFEDHGGIDLIAIGRAAWRDIRSLSLAEGGSTITQQFAKNLLFTRDKKFERKVAEVFAAIEIESRYTKDEIFELYANTVYFGSGYYGIYQASLGYFGKEPRKLNEYESAMLAGIPKAPSIYSPDASKEMASRRTDQVLYSMAQCGAITREEADRIKTLMLKTNEYGSIKDVNKRMLNLKKRVPRKCEGLSF